MKLITLDKVESTNDYGKINLENIEDKTALQALCQTSGRGRLERSWIDLGEGNLFMSLVLKPSDNFKQNFSNLTQYLSVCLCKVLEDYGLSPKIKWPNDVLIDDKKIAGILAESVIKKDCFKGIVLGIGVNLNARSQDLHQITDKKATSLNLEVGKKIDLNDFRDKLLKIFFENYDEFLKVGFPYIEKDYVARNCFLGKELSIQVFDKIQSGFAQAVNSYGELVLVKDKEKITLNIGDII